MSQILEYGRTESRFGVVVDALPDGGVRVTVPNGVTARHCGAGPSVRLRGG